MHGRKQFEILANAHGREHLLEHAKANGVQWEEHNHPGINWMRASTGIVRHLDNGKEFETDHTDENTLRSMLEGYQTIKEHHKQSMIPHIRSAMSKIHADKGDPSLNPMDLLDEAHEHLKANGGSVWAEKINTLHHINTQISNLNSKLSKIGKI